MLSHRISSLRKKKRFSQMQLAQTLHLSPSTVGMYEQGRRVPNLDILIEMSRLFDVSLDYLITGSDYRHSNMDTPGAESAAECPCNTCYWKEYGE